MGWACVVVGAGNKSSPRAFLEFGEHPVGQRLKRPANAVLTGQRQCQPGGKQGAENERDGHGEEVSMEREECVGSVPASEFGHINSHPPVMGEVEELDLAKEASRHCLESESPRIGIRAEFEAGDEQPDANAGLGAGDQRELREDVGCACSRHRDPDQATLGFGRLDLALHAGSGDLRGGRFPLFLGAEPCDGFFVGWDVGGAGSDVSRVDDLFEFQARGVVVDVVGRIGAGSEFVGAGDGDQLDVDLHAVGSVGVHG